VIELFVNTGATAEMIWMTDISCSWLSINHVRLQPEPFIGHRATM